MTTQLAPNSQNEEFCPDWPDTCLCPIVPTHQPLPVQETPCGHCSEGRARTPMTSPAQTQGRDATRLLVMAGAGYCPRCRSILCADCGDQDDPQMSHTCASRPAPGRSTLPGDG